MELIAASQIVRAQNRIKANVAYRAGMTRIVVETANSDSRVAAKILGTPKSPSKVGILAIVGDRGLSGAYNTSVFRTTERLASSFSAGGAQVQIFSVGKKAPAYFRFRGLDVVSSFGGFLDRPSFSDARQVASSVVEPFLDGELDQVLMVSTRFYSAGSQSVAAYQILPIPEVNADNGVLGVGGVGRADSAGGSGGGHEIGGVRILSALDFASGAGAGTGSGAGGGESSVVDAPGGMVKVGLGQVGYTEFEPDPEKLLTELVPRAVESEVFSALLEAAAAFFTAQQRAMAAATENADELIRTLSRIMNRARQDSITTEIMEIVGGAEALRQSKGA